MLRSLARGRGPGFVPELFTGYRPPRDTYTMGLRIVIGVLALVGVTALSPFFLGRSNLSVRGITSGASVQPSALSSRQIEIVVRPKSLIPKVRLTLDGQPVAAEVAGDRLLWRADPSSPLPDGAHRLTVSGGGRVLWRSKASRTINFTIDSTAPTLTIDGLETSGAIDAPVTVRGRAEIGSVVTVAGQVAKLDKQAEFVVKLPRPPVGMLRVSATDAAGNRVAQAVRTGVRLPPLRGVHMTASAWVTPELKNPVMSMINNGQINSVQLDIKDEHGMLGHASAVRMVNQIGATQNLYDLRQAVDELHGRGVRVVGRVVVFRDPMLAAAAWKLGTKGGVVQTLEGQPYFGVYGRKDEIAVFTNPASRLVRNYNLAIAQEAAQAGVDDILFDYIRRPEGSLSKMHFEGMKGTVEDSIISFLHETSAMLRPTQTRVGVSVFGIAAREPETIGQPVVRMARAVDYIAPMVYPSHWSVGSARAWYNVADPNAEPYKIVKESLREFVAQVKGTDAMVVPWLQDFSLGRDYGDREVRAQIDAARDLGLDGFLIWDPRVTYHSKGLPRMPEQLRRLPTNVAPPAGTVKPAA